jgi:hypothetical protein
LKTSNIAPQAMAPVVRRKTISRLMAILPILPLLLSTEKRGNSVALSVFYGLVKLNFR